MQVKRIDSSDENVSKYVFDFGNAVAEAVLYKYPTFEERTVICCSTQSGCPVGCRFCGAGDAFVRSLTGDEIVAQVQHLFADRGIEPEAVQRCQIMFMSMGEPLLNFGGLSYAIRKLHALYPRFSLLISTSAPSVDYERVRALSVEVPAVGLQFSVHESTDEARNALIPFKAKLDLAQIATEGERWFAATGRQPFFNYCAHESNTTPEDALRIYNLFNPAVWQATISVVCERDESVAAANVRQRKLAQDFMQKLMHYGYSTRCFDPAGQDDIGGGCGQLWFVQDWMRNNPELAKPSVGRTIPIVHAPTAKAAESVPAPPPPPECETEAEKRAFAFGWFKALESERMKADSVHEDAARYRWLRINAIGAFLTNGGKGPVSVYHLSKIPAMPGIPEETDAAIDAAMNKGGAA